MSLYPEASISPVCMTVLGITGHFVLIPNSCLSTIHMHDSSTVDYEFDSRFGFIYNGVNVSRMLLANMHLLTVQRDFSEICSLISK